MHVECTANGRSGGFGRRSGPRQYPVRAARRPRADRDRAGICCRRDAADHQRPSRQARRGAASGADEAGPPPLLPAGRASRRANAGKHHERRARRPAAVPAEVASRRQAAPRPHLLRPHRRYARCRPGRSADRARSRHPRRRSRRSDAGRGGISRASSASISRMRAAKRRVFCRPCLDWTERRPHIGGAVGAALADRCFRAEMDRTRARWPRADDYARRAARIDGAFSLQV